MSEFEIFNTQSNESEAKTERQQLLEEVRRFRIRRDRFAEILSGHDGERMWRGFNDSSRENHDLLFFENNEAFGNLLNINQNTSIKVIRERLEIAEKAYNQLEQGIRKRAIQQAQELEKYFQENHWKQTVDTARKGGVDPEFIDAVLRGQRILSQAITNDAGAVAICERLYVVRQRMDRVYWEFANPRGRPSGVLRLSNPSERVTIATGLHVQRNQDGQLEIRADSTHWQSFHGQGVFTGILSLGTYSGMSRSPDGSSWIMWGTANRSMGQMAITSPSEERQRQGYGLQMNIITTHGETYFIRRAN